MSDQLPGTKPSLLPPLDLRPPLRFLFGLWLVELRRELEVPLAPLPPPPLGPEFVLLLLLLLLFEEPPPDKSVLNSPNIPPPG